MDADQTSTDDITQNAEDVAQDAPEISPRSVIFQTLALDHGHARQEGSAYCRSCQRRTREVLYALTANGFEIQPRTPTPPSE